MKIHVVLVHPQIPNNTGNIGRLCVGMDVALHLIEPLGFTIDDARVKRSGLDYWPHLSYHTYPSFAAFVKQQNPEQLYYFTAHAKQELWDVTFTRTEEVYLVFGREADGLPNTVLKDYPGKLVFIPIYSDNIRCYNLANSVSMALMEVKRQQKFIHNGINTN